MGATPNMSTKMNKNTLKGYARVKAWRKENKEKVYEQARSYYLRNKDKIRAYQTAYYKARRLKDAEASQANHPQSEPGSQADIPGSPEIGQKETP